MTVGIYIRVSTEEQARDGFSISAQREKLKAYCIAQDWTDFKFYVDEGISGKNTGRTQLQLMIDHIKQGMIKTVLVHKLDRLTRSVLDLYRLLETFDKHNCSFKSATEVYDTTTAMGRMFITIVAALAQWERENLGERVRMGQIEKARQGKYSAKAPFGFDKNENEQLVINPDEKEVVMDMIEKVRSGSSIRQIADSLNNSGIPPIRGYQWHIATILDVLKNPAIYGAVRWLGELTEDAHEGILTKEEYEKLLKILKSRQNFKRRDTYSIFIFQMKLICPACGNRLTCERTTYFRKKDSKYVENNSYRCQACALNKRKAVSVSEKKIEKALLEYVANIDFDFKPDKEQTDESKTEREKLQKKLIQIEKQREKYQKAWSIDLIEDEEFSKRMEETKVAYDELSSKIDVLPVIDNKEQDTKKIKVIVDDFNLSWRGLTVNDKKEFLNVFIESIEYEKNAGAVRVKSINFY